MRVAVKRKSFDSFNLLSGFVYYMCGRWNRKSDWPKEVAKEVLRRTMNDRSDYKCPGCTNMCVCVLDDSSDAMDDYEIVMKIIVCRMTEWFNHLEHITLLVLECQTPG